MYEFIRVDQWLDIVNTVGYRHSVTVAYVDFSKALDSVSHKKN